MEEGAKGAGREALDAEEAWSALAPRSSDRVQIWTGGFAVVRKWSYTRRASGYGPAAKETG